VIGCKRYTATCEHRFAFVMARKLALLMGGIPTVSPPLSVSLLGCTHLPDSNLLSFDQLLFKSLQRSMQLDNMPTKLRFKKANPYVLRLW
jgi:hypothetical protein